jgi:predicted NAD-dependent protein-ADP-ribosyltransferase YbiA (DUF1768 family)
MSSQEGAMSQEVVNFYGVADEHGCFSNFAAYPIAIDGDLWPTSEHYFQAQKLDDAKHRDAIRLSRTVARDPAASIQRGCAH